MKQLNFVFAIALTILGSHIESAEARSSVASACKSDIERFCSGVRQTRGSLRSCLSAHREKLSQSCKLAMGVTRGR